MLKTVKFVVADLANQSHKYAGHHHHLSLCLSVCRPAEIVLQIKMLESQTLFLWMLCRAFIDVHTGAMLSASLTHSLAH